MTAARGIRRPSLARGTIDGLGSDETGAVAVEFAIVAPVFFLMVFGMLDLGHMAYSKAILNATVQEAARSSALETADTSAADTMVENAIEPLLPNAAFQSRRISYFDFADIGRPERFNDSNANGTCDDNETYTDENRTGSWESDVGSTGNGGAGDVVVYSVSVRYSSVFANPLVPGSSATRELKATAVKKNQPFANQQAYGSEVGVCE